MAATAAHSSDGSGSSRAGCPAGPREGEPTGWSVRVRVAATPTAAAGGRTDTAVIGLLSSGRGPCRQRHETLELETGAAGAVYLLLTPDQLLEFRTAGGASVIVNRHEERFALGSLRVKWPGRSAAR